MEALSTVTSTLATPVSELVPIAGKIFPTETLGYFILDMGPLLYVSLLPLFCGLLAFIGLCAPPDGEGRMKFGARTVLRRVMLAVRADTRMGMSSAQTKLYMKAGFKKGGPAFMQPTASALESGLAFNKAKGGKSADQSKGKKEEAAIKNKTSPPTKKK